jgi:hypothetical protein
MKLALVVGLVVWSGCVAPVAKPKTSSAAHNLDAPAVHCPDPSNCTYTNGTTLTGVARGDHVIVIKAIDLADGERYLVRE